MLVGTTRFDATALFRTDEELAEYLRAALEDGDPGAIATVLGDIARSRGASRLARETGLSRETIYKTFRPGGNPTLGTLSRVAKALGFRLTLEPAA